MMNTDNLNSFLYSRICSSPRAGKELKITCHLTHRYLTSRDVTKIPISSAANTINHFTTSLILGKMRVSPTSKYHTIVDEAAETRIFRELDQVIVEQCERGRKLFTLIEATRDPFGHYVIWTKFVYDMYDLQ